MSVNFKSLTMQTGSGPVANIFIDIRPNVTSSNELFCTSDAGMR